MFGIKEPVTLIIQVFAIYQDMVYEYMYDPKNGMTSMLNTAKIVIIDRFKAI